MQLRPRRPIVFDATGSDKSSEDSGAESEYAPQQEIEPAVVISSDEAGAIDLTQAVTENDVVQEDEVAARATPVPLPPKSPVPKRIVHSPLKPISRIAPRKKTVVHAPLPKSSKAAKPTALKSDHRQRTKSLYINPGSTFRIAQPLKPLQPPELVRTTNAHGRPALQERIKKSWARTIGCGPSWELLEDRRWYKETAQLPAGGALGHVYSDVRVRDEWDFISASDAKQYMPHTNTEEGRTDPEMTCSFGPFDSQQRVQLKTLDALHTQKFFDDGDSLVLFTGGPVWALDWCPLSAQYMETHDYPQYLAVAPLPSTDHKMSIGRAVVNPTFASIQIWMLSKNDKEEMSIACEIVMCIDCGSALQLHWCPLPSHGASTSTENGRLGILAGVFEDGSVTIMSVPDPSELSLEERPAFCHPNSVLLRIAPEETTFISMDWGNSEIIAVGCANGVILIYDVGDAIRDGAMDGLLPLHYVTVHQSAIRELSWVLVPPALGDGSYDPNGNPAFVMSGGYDGCVMFTDTRDQTSVMINRAREVVNSVVVSEFIGIGLTVDSDNATKTFSLNAPTFGRGHFMMDSGGPPLSLATSAFHPYVAVGAADGSCETTNGWRQFRQAGGVPPWVYKIFQLDYSRNLKEFKMLEQFKPHESYDRQALTKDKGKGPGPPIGVWPPEVAVTCVRWNNGSGLGHAPFLASATASGLCRIDWLIGRFRDDQFPYVTIEKMRCEEEGGSEGSEESEE